MTSVCILLQNFYDLDIRVRRKAEALVASGYSVDVYALRGSKGQKQYELAGVNVYTVGLGKKRGSLLRYAFEYLAFFVWCLALVTVRMRKRRYAVVDVNTLPDFLIFAGVFARWMGAKLVLDMHEITPEFYMSKYEIGPNSFLIRVLTVLEKISFDFADHVITINEPIQELLESRGLARGKCSIVTNAADESRFAARSRSSAADAAAESASFVMMYHGTLTRLYGLDLAIEAFAQVHGSMPGAQLWILGGGPEAPLLKTLIDRHQLASKVKLVGQVPLGEIPAWLAKCDVGVLPIRRDVFLEYASPNKLAEFIVSDTPVIISRLKAVQYYFSPAALAYFEPNQPGDLGKQMVLLYGDKDLRRRLVAQAKKEYAPIRWEVMRERYLCLMGELSGAEAQSEARKAAFSQQ